MFDLVFIGCGVTLILGMQSVGAYFIQIDAHAEDCYFDEATLGTKINIIFEVVEGGFLDIDVKVGLWLVIS